MDGSTAAQGALSFDLDVRVTSWSPDDRVLAVQSGQQDEGIVGFVDVGDGTVKWIDSRGSYLWGAAFSPDGRWFAYASDETGAFEIWVRSYPEGSVVRQISEGGGIEPVWCPCGEIFYRNGDRWMSIEVSTTPELRWDSPRIAFETDFVDTPGRSYDVSSDGQKLYVIKQPEPPDGSRLHMVSNWLDDLERRVPPSPP